MLKLEGDLPEKKTVMKPMNLHLERWDDQRMKWSVVNQILCVGKEELISVILLGLRYELIARIA